MKANTKWTYLSNFMKYQCIITFLMKESSVRISGVRILPPAKPKVDLLQIFFSLHHNFIKYQCT